jgi:hypothetical protein
VPLLPRATSLLNPASRLLLLFTRGCHAQIRSKILLATTFTLVSPWSKMARRPKTQNQPHSRRMDCPYQKRRPQGTCPSSWSLQNHRPSLPRRCLRPDQAHHAILRRFRPLLHHAGLFAIPTGETTLPRLAVEESWFDCSIDEPFRVSQPSHPGLFPTPSIFKQKKAQSLAPRPTFFQRPAISVVLADQKRRCQNRRPQSPLISHRRLRNIHRPHDLV